MTVVPLPDTNCVRVQMVYNDSGGLESSSRFFLSYSGGAPSPANCVTLAGDIAAAWDSHLALIINDAVELVLVDVLDISTDSGNSGSATEAASGSRSGTPLPIQCATNVEYSIARRYRGGKPRMFIPPAVTADLANPAEYLSASVSGFLATWNLFIDEVTALSVGTMGTLVHINLSYYSGFTNVTNSSGRTRAAPKYRALAKSDPITGYNVKPVLGSQRKRRTSTTP